MEEVMLVVVLVVEGLVAVLEEVLSVVVFVVEGLEARVAAVKAWVVKAMGSAVEEVPAVAEAALAGLKPAALESQARAASSQGPVPVAGVMRIAEALNPARLAQRASAEHRKIAPSAGA